jgi:hypothetical protein
MLDVEAIKRLGESFNWFLQIGATDAKQVRDELQDLLDHCAATIKAVAELAAALYELKPEEFSENSFIPVYLHCTANYTSPDAARQARSHCTDIVRDVARIKFKVTRLLRAENLQWQSLDQAFARFENADDDFLNQFETDMQLVQGELQQILNLVRVDRQVAWQRYDLLRQTLIGDLAKLSGEFNKMREAEDHVRRILT